MVGATESVPDARAMACGARVAIVPRNIFHGTWGKCSMAHVTFGVRSCGVNWATVSEQYCRQGRCWWFTMKQTKLYYAMSAAVEQSHGTRLMDGRCRSNTAEASLLLLPRPYSLRVPHRGGVPSPHRWVCTTDNTCPHLGDSVRSRPMPSIEVSCASRRREIS